MRLNGFAFGRSAEYVFQGSYFQFYPQFFDDIAPKGNFEYGHLWFLLYLFVFSLIALPILIYLRKEAGKGFVSRLAGVCEKPGVIFLLGIPFAIIQASLRARWPGFQNLYDDWANFFFYITFFIYGYVLVSDERFKKAIERHCNISLAMGAALISLIFIWRWGVGDPASDYSPAWLLYMLLHGFNTWFWIIAILGFGSKYLSFRNRPLLYSSEAALPFYILHQTAIVVIGYYAIRCNLHVLGKFISVCILSTVASLVFYELVVKRTNLTRFLFGMKAKKTRPIEKKIHMARTNLEEA
jgi:surface polysaccharide O-acyltransferase-like enzyme